MFAYFHFRIICNLQLFHRILSNFHLTRHQILRKYRFIVQIVSFIHVGESRIDLTKNINYIAIARFIAVESILLKNECLFVQRLMH